MYSIQEYHIGVLSVQIDLEPHTAQPGSDWGRLGVKDALLVIPLRSSTGQITTRSVGCYPIPNRYRMLSYPNQSAGIPFRRLFR